MTSNEQVLVRYGSNKWLKDFIHYERKDWIEKIKTIPGRWWGKRDKCWLLPNTSETIDQLRQLFGDQLIVDLTPSLKEPASVKVKPVVADNSPPLSRDQYMAITALEQQLMLERKSYSTVKSYKHHLRRFFQHFPKVSPEALEEKQIKDYLLHHIRTSKISVSTQNQIINSIKAYYERVLGQPRKTYYLSRPKKPNQLPHVLSEEEVLAILKATENLKHRCILLLVYSAGLRLSEVVNLKIKDIDSQRMQIFIQGGKGKKDRYTLLSKKALLYLRRYQKLSQNCFWEPKTSYFGIRRGAKTEHSQSYVRIFATKYNSKRAVCRSKDSFEIASVKNTGQLIGCLKGKMVGNMGKEVCRIFFRQPVKRLNSRKGPRSIHYAIALRHTSWKKVLI